MTTPEDEGGGISHGGVTNFHPLFSYCRNLYKG